MLTGAVVTDDLADVLDNATLGTIGAGGTLSRDDADLDGPDVAAGGAVATLAYTVTVNADAYNQTLATWSTPGPGGECARRRDCTTEHPTPHYVLAKSAIRRRGRRCIRATRSPTR